MISAEIIADSVNPVGNRLTTFKLVYPRYIHSEMLRHRVLSHSVQSSRAVPVGRTLKKMFSEMVRPLYWGAQKRGMQCGDKLPRHRALVANLVWSANAYFSAGCSWLLGKLGVHKQWANRPTEPFSHVTEIASGTEWGNFFNLRAHPDAMPEFQELACRMLEALGGSIPKNLAEGQWHLPFADKHVGTTDLASLLKISVARCGRTSYLNFDGDFSTAKDFTLHDTFVKSFHVSPLEHQGRAEISPVRSGNFVGFTQYRKLFSGENQSEFNPGQLLGRCVRHA